MGKQNGKIDFSSFDEAVKKSPVKQEAKQANLDFDNFDKTSSAPAPKTGKKEIDFSDFDNAVGVDALKKKEQTQENIPTTSTSDLVGSTSELEGTPLAVPEEINVAQPAPTPQEVAIPKPEGFSFIPGAEQAPIQDAVALERPVIDVDSMEDIDKQNAQVRDIEASMKANISANPRLMDAEGSFESLREKVLDSTGSFKVADAVVASAKKIKHESDILTSESLIGNTLLDQESLDAVNESLQFMPNIEEQNRIMEKNSLIQGGMSEEEAEITSQDLYPSKERLVEIEQGVKEDEKKRLISEGMSFAEAEKATKNFTRKPEGDLSFKKSIKTINPDGSTTEVADQIFEGLNMDKVTADYLNYVKNTDPDKFSDLESNLLIGDRKNSDYWSNVKKSLSESTNEKKEYNYISDALIHQHKLLDTKVGKILEKGEENLTEDDLAMIEGLENEMSLVRKRGTNLLQEFPALQDKFEESKAKQKAVDLDYQTAKVRSLLPGWEGMKAEAAQKYYEILAPMNRATTRNLNGVSQALLNISKTGAREAGFDEIGTFLGAYADKAGEYFAETGERIATVPSSLDKEAVTIKDGEVDVNYETILPKTVELLTNMSYMIEGGGFIGKGLKRVGAGANIANRTGIAASSFVTTYNDFYEEALETGRSEKEANKDAGVLASVLGVIESYNPQSFLFDASIKKGVKSAMIKSIAKGMSTKEVIKEGTKFMGKQILEEELEELTALASENVIKNQMNDDSRYEKYEVGTDAQEVAETVLMTAVVSGIFGAGGIKGKNQLQKESMYSAATNLEKFNSLLDAEVKRGKYSEEEAVTLTENVEEYKKIVDGLPEDTPQGTKIQLADLISQKEQLKKEQKAVITDDVVVAKKGDEIQTKIDEVNGQIELVFEEETKTEKKDVKPTIEVNTKADEVSYTIDEGFFSEAEIVEKLNNEEFVQSVKDGESNLNISNPSPEVQASLEKSGLVEPDKTEPAKKKVETATQEEIDFNQEVTPVKEKKAEEVKTDVTVDENAPIEKVEPVKNKEIINVKEGSIETTEEVTLLKGLEGKKSPTGEAVNAHPDVKGVFSTVDSKTAEEYAGETGVSEIKIPAGTTVEVIEIDTKGLTPKAYRQAETDAINNSEAQVVKLITVDGKISKDKSKSEQYIVKDKSLLPKREAPAKPVGKQKIAEGFEELLDAIGGKANIAPNMFNKPSAFNALKKITEGVVEETGLQGEKLIKEIKKRLKEALGDKFQESDIDDIKSEVTAIAKKAKKVEPKKVVEKTVEKVEVKKPKTESKTEPKTEPKTANEAPKKVVEKVEVKKPKTESKKAEPKTESKKAEPKRKGIRKSKATSRVLENEMDPELKAKLDEFGNYETFNAVEHAKVIDELIESMGVDAAIEYAYTLGDSLSDGSAIRKKTILLEAGSRKLEQANAAKLKAEQDNDIVAKAEAEDAVIQSYIVINDGSQIGTQGGQLSSIDKELHKRHPSLYMIGALKDLETKGSLADVDSFTDESGNPITTEQAINDLRAKITEELKSDLEKEFDSKIKELEGKIEALKKAGKKTATKAEDTAKKKKEIKKDISDKWAKFRVASRGEASMALMGMNNTQIELLGSIVADYVRLGGLSSQQIINKVTKEAKGMLPWIEKDHVENIARKLNEFNEKIAEEKVARLEKAKNEGLSEKETEALIKDVEKISGKKIIEVAKDHYVNRVGAAQSLTQTLIEDAGIDAETAIEIAKSIEEVISGKIEERVAVEVKKFIEKTEKSDPKKKVNKKLNDKIIEAVNLGALNNADAFLQAFQEKFGFTKLDERDAAKLKSLIQEITILENNNKEEVEIDGKTVEIDKTSRNEILKRQREFNTILESATPLTVSMVLKEINSAIYISILSNVSSTSIKALLGSIGGATFGVASQTLMNPWTSLLGITAATKGLGTSFRRAGAAMRTGVVEVGQTRTMGEFSSAKQSMVEKVLFGSVTEALKDGKYLKAAAGMLGKTVMNVRLLSAMDAFLVSQSGIYYDTVSEAGTKTEKGSIEDRISKRDKEIAYRKIANEEFDNLKADIINDVELDIKQGKIREKNKDKEIKKRLKESTGGSFLSNQRKAYTEVRIQELVENERFESFKAGWGMGQYFSLVGKPDGYVGMATSKFANVLSMNNTDDAGTATGKFVGNMLFKFVNLMGNFYAATMASVPVLGIATAFMGAGFNPQTGEYDTRIFKGKLASNKKLVYTRLASNLITTTMTVAALFDQMDWDDEEEEFVLSPDRSMDFRGSGFGGMGGFAKNAKHLENYEPFSFSYTKGEDGQFTDYKNYNQYVPQLNAIVATVGAYTDDLKGLGKKGVIARRKDSPFFSRGLKVLEENFKGFTQGSFNSLGRAIKPFMYEETAMEGLTSFVVNTLSDNISPLMKPNSHIAVSKYIKSAMGVSKKQAKSVGERMMQNFYGLDGYVLSEKTDAFGNPYPETNDIERFITEVPKMSELFPKTAGLLFKFPERGVDVGKWRPSTMKAWSEGISFKGRKWMVSEDLQDEAIEIQEKLFNDMVLDNYESINNIETVEVLENVLKKYQAFTKKQAKGQLIDKYYDATDKNSVIKLMEK